ncbi:MAG: hypothetical protein NXY57DRAFT_1068603 [Lentinula lateritia]|nr:MAG: hypothetical protein NXY57DRAFT_1068603 [Lentinula lateritia]
MNPELSVCHRSELKYGQSSGLLGWMITQLNYAGADADTDAGADADTDAGASNSGVGGAWWLSVQGFSGLFAPRNILSASLLIATIHQIASYIPLFLLQSGRGGCCFDAVYAGTVMTPQRSGAETYRREFERIAVVEEQQRRRRQGESTYRLENFDMFSRLDARETDEVTQTASHTTLYTTNINLQLEPHWPVFSSYVWKSAPPGLYDSDAIIFLGPYSVNKMALMSGTFTSTFQMFCGSDSSLPMNVPTPESEI